VIEARDNPRRLARPTSERRDTLRDAAKTLVFAPASDEETQDALQAAQMVLLSILRRGCDPWAERLAGDVARAGPATSEELAA
jgi:hypothetical protein